MWTQEQQSELFKCQLSSSNVQLYFQLLRSLQAYHLQLELK